MKALDLFCGGGGAALGLIQAGFDVVGVDVVRRHARVYPGRFVCASIERLPFDLADFDLIWASPPCQKFSTATPLEKKVDHVDYIPLTRELMKDHPYTIIENVPLAPIRPDVRLSGPMVGLNQIQRIRHFELSFYPGLVGPVQKVPTREFREGRAVTITKSMSAVSHYYARVKLGMSGRVSVKEARRVMGIETKMTAFQIGEAIPPAYSRFLAERAVQSMKGEL